MENGERDNGNAVNALVREQLVVGDTTNPGAEDSGSQTAQGGQQSVRFDTDKLLTKMPKIVVEEPVDGEPHNSQTGRRRSRQVDAFPSSSQPTSQERRRWIIRGRKVWSKRVWRHGVAK